MYTSKNGTHTPNRKYYRCFGVETMWCEVLSWWYFPSSDEKYQQCIKQFITIEWWTATQFKCVYIWKRACCTWQLRNCLIHFGDLGRQTRYCWPAPMNSYDIFMTGKQRSNPTSFTQWQWSDSEVSLTCSWSQSQNVTQGQRRCQTYRVCPF